MGWSFLSLKGNNVDLHNNPQLYTQISTALKSAADLSNAIPGVQAAFHTLLGTLESIINTNHLNEVTLYREGIHPVQKQINLILKMTNQPEEDLSWWAACGSKNTDIKRDKFFPNISFDEMKERAKEDPRYICTEHAISRKFEIKTKWWTNVVSLNYHRADYFSCHNVVFRFFDSDIPSLYVHIPKNSLDIFMKDLKVSSLLDGLGGSSLMFDYVNKYTIKHTDLESWYD